MNLTIIKEKIQSKVGENLGNHTKPRFGAFIFFNTLFFTALNNSYVYASSNGLEFFNKGVDVIQMIIIAIGAIILIMGIINFLDAYTNDNAGAKSQGQKQFIAGAGIIVVALLLIPELKTLITTT